MKLFRGLIAAVLCGATMLSVAGCKSEKVKSIDDEDVFFDALKKTAGISKNDMMVNDKNTQFDGMDVEYLTFTDEGCNSYCYIRFEDEEDAYEMFKSKYDSFEELLDDKDFEGDNKRNLKDDQGYLILDGEVAEGAAFDGLTFNTRDTHYYGGFYVNKNVYIAVYSLNGDSDEMDTVDAMLKELDFPAM